MSPEKINSPKPERSVNDPEVFRELLRKIEYDFKEEMEEVPGRIDPKNDSRENLKIIRQFTKVMVYLFLASLMSTIWGARKNYLDTRFSVTVEKTEDGKETYRHEDERTTHYLNILAGVEEFNQEDILVDFRINAEKFARKFGYFKNQDFNTMSIQEIEDFYLECKQNGFDNIVWEETNFDESIKKGVVLTEFQRALERNKKYFITGEELFERHKNIYEMIWQLEKECGNPKIRLSCESPRFTPVNEFQEGFHYNPIQNTVYIDISTLSPVFYSIFFT